MSRYEIRALLPGDEPQLLALAQHLNSVNLPVDPGRIAEIVELAHGSFTGSIEKHTEREYVFVLVDRGEGGEEPHRIVGTSMIIAQLGRRGAPYIYFDVMDEEKYSATIDKHFHHKVLRIGYSYNGPTEIGGLVIHPEYRKASERLGTMISYVRFLFLKAHRELFRPEVVAELLPPLEPDGTSHLWEALGRKFTGLDYAEADVLSKRNKEFIKGLFPEGAVYATLLSQQAQDVIGKVGAQTRGVEKLLRRVGFRYADRVDPFDGGPHFFAEIDDVTLVRNTKKLVLGPPLEDGETAARGLVAVELPVAPFFRCVAADVRMPERTGWVSIGRDAHEHLGVEAGGEVWVLPFG
jgi:arginine N-succinyltransferase